MINTWTTYRYIHTHISTVVLISVGLAPITRGIYDIYFTQANQKCRQPSKNCKQIRTKVASLDTRLGPSVTVGLSDKQALFIV